MCDSLIAVNSWKAGKITVDINLSLPNLGKTKLLSFSELGSVSSACFFISVCLYLLPSSDFSWAELYCHFYDPPAPQCLEPAKKWQKLKTAIFSLFFIFNFIFQIVLILVTLNYNLKIFDKKKIFFSISHYFWPIFRSF